MKRRFTATILILFVFLALACGGALPTPRYGAEYNAMRQKLGVPIVPSDWIPNAVGNDDIWWENPDGDTKHSQRIPVHYRVLVDHPDGILTSETHFYYGSQNYTLSINGSTHSEELIVTYYYNTDSAKKDYVFKELDPNWRIRISNQENEAGKDLTVEEAEKILNEWGLSLYSDYPKQP